MKLKTVAITWERGFYKQYKIDSISVLHDYTGLPKVNKDSTAHDIWVLPRFSKP